MVLEFPQEKKRTPAEEQVYFDRLEKEKVSLLDKLGTLKNEEIGKIDSADDLAGTQQDRVRKEETANNLNERLEEIKKTITWARENGFICSVCHKKIETGRLDADPASITCKEHLANEDDKLGLAA
ncbi:MAG: hypothetical protein WC531_02630 [Candidatus Paceibacterota bacterium]|jgi:RNA polymerase-binding transcription factor DksA